MGRRSRRGIYREKLRQVAVFAGMIGSAIPVRSLRGFDPLRYLNAAVLLTAICLSAPLLAQDAQPLAAGGASAPADPVSDPQSAPLGATREKWNYFVHETEPFDLRRRGIQCHVFPSDRHRSAIRSQQHGLCPAVCGIADGYRQ